MPKWKGQKLKYLHAQKKKGVWYTYYRRDGQYAPIQGEPGTSRWMKSYTTIHEGWNSSAPGVSRNSFEAVAAAYCDHREFKATSEKNQARRRQHLDVICKGWGKVNIRRITRGNVISLRDLLADKHSPAYARECLATIKALFNFAHDCDMVDANITKGIKLPAGYKVDPHAPWTDEQIEAFLEQAPDRWRRAVMVLLHTGLRLGDAVKIRRQDIRDGAIYWKTSKRKTDVVIPLTQALKDELSRTAAHRKHVPDRRPQRRINGEPQRWERYTNRLPEARFGQSAADPRIEKKCCPEPG